MRMRRTDPWTDRSEDEDKEDWPGAGGRLRAPTRGQYTLGVGAAVADHNGVHVKNKSAFIYPFVESVHNLCILFLTVDR